MSEQNNIGNEEASCKDDSKEINNISQPFPACFYKT